MRPALLGARLAHTLGALLLIEARDHAREESRLAVLTAARALDEGDELAVDTERCRILCADARADYCDRRISEMAMDAREAA